MDLTEAEGLADLIDAETEDQRQQALRQMQGGLKATYEAWREGLLDALAAIEGEIDFPDEGDVPDALAQKAGPDIDAVIALIDAALNDAARGEHIRHGLDIAIIGPPNAGKSTLINALAGREAAIVSDEAGTTRDIVEVHMVISALPVRVSDTAGLRDTDNTIEAEGVRRARARGAEADIRIGVLDASDTELINSALPSLMDDLQPDDILVLNKSDLAQKTAHPRESGDLTASRDELTIMQISAQNTADIDTVRDYLETLIRERYAVSESAGLTRARHRDCSQRALDALRRGRANLSTAPELSGDDLRTALHSIKELAGEADIEAVLDRVFSRFCIGK
jgi:tRNA modification GTPase